MAAVQSCIEANGWPSVPFQITKTQLGFGDYACNAAMLLGKHLKQNPMEIAEKIKEYLERDADFSEKVVVVKPGFINFWLDTDTLLEILVAAVEEGSSFCADFANDNRLHIVEYSSPNIAKPFTVGHLRSTIIGASIAKILKHAGYNVITDNHLGDYGTQFGALITAIKKWGNEKDLDSSTEPIKDLVALYQKFHAEVKAERKALGLLEKDDPEAEDDSKSSPLEDEARGWFRKLEQGDPEAARIWKKCVDLSMIEFNTIYERLGVSFDTYWGESFFREKMDTVIADLREKNLLRESEGAQLVFFPEPMKLPPAMILKKDGGSLYITRDLATDKYRRDYYGTDTVVINEVGKEQVGHFDQLFALEEMLGYFPKNQRVHVKHGHYRFKTGKMSTRAGNVIWLNDVLDNAVDAVKRVVSEIDPKDAEKIGLGAIKFYDLSRAPEGDIVFDADKMVDTKGATGPYIQYAIVRARTLVAKAYLEEFYLPEGLQGVVLLEEELVVARVLEGFAVALKKAAEEYSPHYLATYLLSLASAYNTYYAAVKVISEKRTGGLLVSKAVHNVLTLGLSLLGIDVPEKM